MRICAKRKSRAYPRTARPERSPRRSGYHSIRRTYSPEAHRANMPGLRASMRPHPAFRPGRNLDYYVRAAGGYSKAGDKTRAWVTQPNGRKEAVQRRALLPDTSPEPRPGAEVFVPDRDPSLAAPGLVAILGAAAQVLAS